MLEKWIKFKIWFLAQQIYWGLKLARLKVVYKGKRGSE